MIYSAEVTTHDEIIQIHTMNQLYLRSNLSQQVQEEEGFVSWLYPVFLLQQMHSIAPSIIVKDDEQVVGYALVTPIEAGSFHHDLKILIDHLETIDYKEKPLLAYSYYVMGQVCIDKEYRGKGIFSMLFQKHKKNYSDQYELLVTEISTKNLRSQKAHEKVGFTTIYTYTDTVDEWNVVVWDWR